MRNRFFSTVKDTEEKIAALQKQRELCRDRIRSLREGLQELEEAYAQADDLDQKILEGDLLEKKGFLETETEHFKDLGELIDKLRRVQRVKRTKRSLMDVFRISERINVRKMLQEEDEVDIRRELLRDEAQ